MKRFFLPLLLIVGLASCGGGDKEAETQETTTATETKAPKSMVTDEHASNPDYAKGSELVTKYQCMACHKVDEKLTGPSYIEVANKYAPANDATTEKLAKKIIEGGTGVWGEIPMTSHPNVSNDDAKAMVKYIMLLKK